MNNIEGKVQPILMVNYYTTTIIILMQGLVVSIAIIMAAIGSLFSGCKCTNHHLCNYNDMFVHHLTQG